MQLCFFVTRTGISTQLSNSPPDCFPEFTQHTVHGKFRVLYRFPIDNKKIPVAKATDIFLVTRTGISSQLSKGPPDLSPKFSQHLRARKIWSSFRFPDYKIKSNRKCDCFLFGDPDGNRTRVTAVKGRCLNRLTTGPLVALTGFEPVTLRV